MGNHGSRDSRDSSNGGGSVMSDQIKPGEGIPISAEAQRRYDQFVAEREREREEEYDREHDDDRRSSARRSNPDRRTSRPTAGGGFSSFVRGVLPGDWLKVIAFVAAIVLGALQIKGDVGKLQADVAENRTQWVEMRTEIRSLQASIEELKIQQARQQVLLERILAEQQLHK